MQKGGGRDRERGGLEQKKPPLSGEKGPEPFYSRYTTLSLSGRGGEQNARKQHKKNNFLGLSQQFSFFLVWDKGAGACRLWRQGEAGTGGERGWSKRNPLYLETKGLSPFTPGILHFPCRGGEGSKTQESNTRKTTS